jgi:hypothetical protein
MIYNDPSKRATAPGRNSRRPGMGSFRAFRPRFDALQTGQANRPRQEGKTL